MTNIIVTRQDAIEALKRQTFGRTGTVEPDAADATKIVIFARRILPLIVQGEALFWENGGKIETPHQARFALALHQAEPEMFAFTDCACSKYAAMSGCLDKPDQACGRRRWLDLVRDRAQMPATVETTPIPVPLRGER